MDNPPYNFRNYRPADFDGYARLNADSARLAPAGRGISPPALRESLRRPGYAPEQDMLVAETGGEIVGFMNITPERGIRRIILDCLVHPEHRRRGIARQLLDHAMRRAGELEAEVAHVNVSQENLIARTVLSRLGFRVVRRYLELRLELAGAQLPETARDSYSYRHLQPGEEPVLAGLQNRCFAGTWGYNPNTAGDISFYLESGGYSPEDVIFVCDAGQPLGYCWTRFDDTEAAGRKNGRIHMLGVTPEHRGKRTGMAVLLAGLRHLKTRGVKTAELTADSENKAACALYQSIGFETRASSLWYEKAVG